MLGTRIEELLFTKIVDVYLDDGYFIAGLKTSNGKRRAIPIHHELLPIFKYYYTKNKRNEFLFTIDNKKIDYNSQFLKLYNALMDKLNMEHNTHDGRRTLHSEFSRIKATDQTLDELCVDRIFGHKADNFGDDVYSKKGIEELKDTIEKIDYRSKIGTKITYLKVSNSM